VSLGGSGTGVRRRRTVNPRGCFPGKHPTYTDIGVRLSGRSTFPRVHRFPGKQRGPGDFDARTGSSREEPGGEAREIRAASPGSIRGMRRLTRSYGSLQESQKEGGSIRGLLIAGQSETVHPSRKLKTRSGHPLRPHRAKLSLAPWLVTLESRS
jgi:hypothetical protein